MAKKWRVSLLVLLVHLTEFRAWACIWDATTLEEEKARRPNLAEVILNQSTNKVDKIELLKRVETLQSTPRTNDPTWWNNLAGAYIRLGKSKEAASLLEPVIKLFPNDYAMHANLGTAYHLLQNYAEAEREIRRGLELNPQAHFGLERYHLALLQYLIRDDEYKKRHVYVDEWSTAFLTTQPEHFKGRAESDILEAAIPPVSYTNSLPSTNVASAPRYIIERDLGAASAADTPPEYRHRWNLAHDTNFLEGVTYMAQLNQSEPAAFVMAGIAAFSQRDFHLGSAAFQRAIDLDSPQRQLLQWRLDDAKDYIEKSKIGPHPLTTGSIVRILTFLLLLGLTSIVGITLLAKFIIRLLRKQ